jgi:hypothetical protein
MSKQGKNLLVKDGTTIKSIAIEVSISHNTTEFSVNSTALTDMLDLGSIVWDANSSYFIFRNTGEDNKIYSADNTGNNINILLLSDNIASDAYGIPIDNSGLIVVMLDDANNTPTRQANLYKLKFK